MRYAIVAGLALLACGCTTTDGAASGAGPAPTAKASGAQACAAFNPASLGLADAKVTYYPADPAKGLPANCDVSGTLHPVAGSNIGVVYRLPDAWNGKVYGIGGGGWAGNVTLQAGSDALKAGYATMQTDGGHPGTGVWDNAWAQNPEAAKDFSYRAIHEMTVAGKKLATAYYGRKFDNAYYVGCSTGGRMGLMEAQRYPDDYDAIVAGAPVYTLQTQTTGLMRTNAFGAPGAAFTADDLQAGAEFRPRPVRRQRRAQGRADQRSARVSLGSGDDPVQRRQDRQLPRRAASRRAEVALRRDQVARWAVGDVADQPRRRNWMELLHRHQRQARHHRRRRAARPQAVAVPQSRHRLGALLRRHRRAASPLQRLRGDVRGQGPEPVRSSSLTAASCWCGTARATPARARPARSTMPAP